MSRRGRLGALLAVVVLAAGCSSTSDAPAVGSDPDPSAGGHHDGADEQAPPATPLRDGERLTTLTMPAAYTPSPPLGSGTDDYRCFLLDPGLEQDAFVTGLDVLPGTEDVVHHVILFQVPPEAVPFAEEKDAAEEGQGWTCFGGTGVGNSLTLDDAPWLGAWAPGGGETLMARDVGVPVEAGARVIMQVHYNLLAGSEPDVTAARLRLVDGGRDLRPLETMLLPAPVELPCRPENATEPLCDRAAAVADVQERFGDPGRTANLLHLLCGQQEAGPVQRCDRTVEEPATVRAVAGHMHLLGRSISIEVNPGTPRARTVLDLPVWDFDNQSAKPVEPLRLRGGDTVRVTCEHDQSLRDVLPTFEGQPDRWVVWGEGTTDEMCLGMLMVTRP